MTLRGPIKACPHLATKVAENSNKLYPRLVAENGNKSCPKRQQKLPETETKRLRFWQQIVAGIVAGNSDFCCRFLQHLLPFLATNETATFVAVSGDNLSPFSATFVASVDRPLLWFSPLFMVNVS